MIILVGLHKLVRAKVFLVLLHLGANLHDPPACYLRRFRAQVVDNAADGDTKGDDDECESATDTMVQSALLNEDELLG